MRRVLFFAVLLIVLLGAGQLARAQDETNLLQNPGFEGGYFAWFNISEVYVAHGWTPWWRERTEDDPPSTYFRPEYKQALVYNFPRRVRSGESAQQWFTFHATHVAGMYQQVFNVTPGTRYRFTIWGQVWSSADDDPDYSTDPAYPNLQVGIDPTGNWNPWSSDVIWSGTYTFFDTWGQLAVEAVARNDVITVFMRSAPNFPVKHNDMYWDDAVLVALGPGGAVPTATAVPPTAVPPTTAPGDTPVPTSPPQPTVTCSPPPEDWVTVTVQRGDTLYALSRRHGTTLDAAVAANCLRTTDIYVGQVLWLPPLAATATAAPATPTVTPPSQTETATSQPSPTGTPTGTPTAVPATATPTATSAPIAVITATSAVPASATPTRVSPSATLPSSTTTSAAPSDGGTRPCGTLALSAGIVLLAGVFSWRSKKH
jgi:LysM repeat protein